MQKKLLPLLLFITMVALHTIALAQGISVSGRVTAAQGNTAIPGVSLQIKGSKLAAQTDADGRFAIILPSSKEIIVVTSVGFLAQEISLNGLTEINISLVASVDNLSEVVVIGYGTVRKRDLTGSVSQVKAKDINAFPSTNVLQALSGRAAGVQVIQNTGSPGGSVSVRIRGTNSIQGSNEPLYVVDGFPVAGSNPTNLNNSDIESIEILKDASATAIYGSRGANGVVLITTKRGKAGKTQVDVESSYSTQSLRKKLDLMNAKQYATFYNEQAKNDNVAPYFTQPQVDSFGTGFDWQDFVFQKAPMKTLSVNVNGGNDKTQFSISGSVFDQEGIIKGSNYKRYSFRTNLNHEISKKFSVSFSTILTRINTDRRNNDGNNRGGSMISAAISAPPTLTPFNPDGTYRVLNTAYPFISNVLTNPINFLNEQTDEIRANRILTNGAITYKPIPELSIKISGGLENADDRNDAYTTRNFVNSQGNAFVRSSQALSLLSENTITYTKTFNKKHNFSALAGFTYQDFVNTSLTGSGNGYISDLSQTFDLGAAITPGIAGSAYSKSVLLSYLSRVNYAYNNKYLATISMRADGSSKYSQGNKWGYFPSVALAWRIANEDFFKNVTFVSDLKFRLGWGRTGSQAIGPYATLNQLGSGKTVFDDAQYTTYSPGTRLPANLKWETTEQKDIGLDFGILHNRVIVSVDYYIKDTRDLLNSVRLPSSLGFTSTIRNIGQVQNKGLELGLNVKALTGIFQWDINANISFNRNKVIKLYGGKDILGGFVDVTAVNDNANILREGQPIGRFYGYVEDGYTADGKIKYKDIDRDGVITAKDKDYIGDPNPNFIYGFNSVMAYKNLEFIFFLQGTQGNNLYNVSSINNTIDYGFGLNMPKDVYNNHWTSTKTNAKYPVISRTSSANASNRWVEDGSYLRLKNIQFAYNLPVKNFGIASFRSLQVYVSGQNLLTLTKYTWWDPEVNSGGGSNSTSQGFDYYSYPTAKSVTFGFRAGF